MMVFGKDIPDEAVTLWCDAYALIYGYQAEIDGRPNPQSKLDFFADLVIASIKERVFPVVLKQRTKSFEDAEKVKLEAEINTGVSVIAVEPEVIP